MSIYETYVCMLMFGGMFTTAHVWKSDDDVKCSTHPLPSLREDLLFFTTVDIKLADFLDS